MYRFDKAPIPVFPSVGFHIDISFDVPQFPCSLRPQKLIMYDKNVCIMHSATLSVISPYIVPHHIWTMHYTNGFPSNEKNPEQKHYGIIVVFIISDVLTCFQTIFGT